MSKVRLSLRFSLFSLLMFMNMTAAYVGLHVFLEKTYPAHRDARTNYLLAESTTHYYYRVPKDLASIVVCCLFLQRGMRSRPAAILGGTACLLSVLLSCGGFCFSRWNSGFIYAGNTALIWSSLAALSWVLMVFALWYAVRQSVPTRPAVSNSGRH